MRWALILALLLSANQALAIGQQSFVVHDGGAFKLFADGHAAAIQVDEGDWPGVARAAHDLQGDIEAVTGVKPDFGAGGIVIGTIGKSPAIDRLIAEGKIDVADVKGQWEAYLIQAVDNQLVVAGADKRGTIFGIYDISEQIGVSPFYWWADVPVRRSNSLQITAGRHVGKSPAVKYRGIFLNDEAPALSGWAKEFYGTLDHRFYAHVFELILRLRGNFLWPAMWANAFNEDDPLNPKLADEYGIVMGTSHHEPMMRAQQEWKRHGVGEWDYATNGEVLRKFWAEGVRRNRNYEELTTIGMRGDGDKPMTDSEQNANTKLLEKIVADQRKILAKEVNPDVTKVPQVWALYKEVQLYYEQGMRVPDDVTLLWSDDNWGNVRRLPSEEERERAGGAGIYYHFDYVGGPRNYKWINTNPIAKVWDQMSLAYDYGADRIWVVNVGDLKPMEFPIEYFLTLARDPKAWPKERLDEYTKLWAAREFGAKYADEAADLVTRYGMLIGRRKPEMIDPATFSIENYSEADRVVGEYHELLSRAEKLQNALPQPLHDAFFELVLYPIKAAGILTEMYVDAGKNRLYAAQGLASANYYAEKVRELFAADAALGDYYNHQLAGGKWDHMMDQTHIGYTTWQQPEKNMMPEVREVEGGTGPGGEIMPVIPAAKPATGTTFIESDGYVSMEAEHFSAKTDYAGVSWQKIPNYGRTLSGMEPFPTTANGASPRLDYQMILTNPGDVTVKAILGPSLPFVPGRGLRYAIAFDDQPRQIVDIDADMSEKAWSKAVSDNVRTSLTKHHLGGSGTHTLKIWMVDPGIVLEKLVVDLGGEKPSYLGPPESARQ